MTKFFNTIENTNKAFPFFSELHIIPLLIVLAGSYAIITNVDSLKKEKNRRIFMISIGILMLSQQILLYTWYNMSSIGFLKDGLPLYLSRITSISIVIAFLTNKKSLNFIIFFIGSLGSVIALSIPDTSGYVFPHIMYIQFFTIHGCMFLATLFLFFVDNYRPDKNEFKKIIKFIIAYSIIISFINGFLGANYGYLEHPPASAKIFDLLPPGIIYKLGITAVMCSLMTIIYVLFRKIPTESKFKLSIPFSN